MQTINHRDWTGYDAQGYMQARSIEVHRYDDGTIRVGRSLFAEHELVVSDDGGRIDHIGGAWYLTRPAAPIDLDDSTTPASILAHPDCDLHS